MVSLSGRYNVSAKTMENVIVVGEVRTYVGAAYDQFSLAKFRNDGHKEWYTQSNITSSSYNLLYDIAFDWSNNGYVVGKLFGMLYGAKIVENPQTPDIPGYPVGIVIGIFAIGLFSIPAINKKRYFR